MSNYVDSTMVMLCWNPNSPEIALVPWPDQAMVSHQYQNSSLACERDIQEMTFEQRQQAVMAEAIKLVERDGCPADVVHRVLSGLAEYQA
ncbi:MULTISPECIES: hypothetical protein [Aeromonas]|nr:MULTISPECIES: hypothetical protein [Aeromonas]MBL0563131.1 hypothetical protein [Aeromonas hydrophila]MCP3287015.1 hypothetical protein [Aeromonas hydrophila]